MFRPILIAAALVLSLSGCTSLKTLTPTDGHRDWIFTPANHEPAKLAFGKPYTDDLDILLWCRKESHAVRATVGSDEDQFQQAILQSGATTLRLKLFQDDYSGLVGDMPLEAPLLKTFARTGDLTMTLDNDRVSKLNGRSREGRREIAKFFQACR